MARRVPRGCPQPAPGRDRARRMSKGPERPRRRALRSLRESCGGQACRAFLAERLENDGASRAADVEQSMDIGSWQAARRGDALGPLDKAQCSAVKVVAKSRIEPLSGVIESIEIKVIAV